MIIQVKLPSLSLLWVKMSRKFLLPSDLLSTPSSLKSIFLLNRYTINLWDIGGQSTIRSYWRNYFEQTDGVIWVVDSSDKLRLEDCKLELHNLLKQEVKRISNRN